MIRQVRTHAALHAAGGGAPGCGRIRSFSRVVGPENCRGGPHSVVGAREGGSRLTLAGTRRPLWRGLHHDSVPSRLHAKPPFSCDSKSGISAVAMLFSTLEEDDHGRVECDRCDHASQHDRDCPEQLFDDGGWNERWRNERPRRRRQWRISDPVPVLVHRPLDRRPLIRWISAA